MKQIDLFKENGLKFFGGALLKGKRKGLRPLSSKHPIHLVMRSEKAFGAASFRRHLRQIEKLLSGLGRRFGVRVYRKAIQSNHIHLVIRIHDRQSYRYFISAIAGSIAKAVSRGAGLGKQKRSFWAARPFTRILSWGRDYRGTLAYLMQNVLEAIGFIEYKPRKNYYAKYFAETCARGETGGDGTG